MGRQRGKTNKLYLYEPTMFYVQTRYKIRLFDFLFVFFTGV